MYLSDTLRNRPKNKYFKKPNIIELNEFISLIAIKSTVLGINNAPQLKSSNFLAHVVKNLCD